MSSRFKKVSLALYLDPSQSKADQYAFNTLSNWAKRRQELSLDSSATMELHQLVHVHKDIYLSGLFLYQLKPELAKSMSAALASDTINESSLFDALNLNQIYNHEQAGKSNTTESSSQADYSEQLDALLAGQEESKNHISSLKALLDENTASSKEPVGSEPHPDYSQNFEALKSQQAETHKQLASANQQIATLQQLIKDQSRLISQLMQQGVTVGNVVSDSAHMESDSKSPMLPNEPKEQVEQRLAKVQKMKKKGIF